MKNYLLDGRLKLDNNMAENAIRPIALSRKNFMLSKAFDNMNYPKYPVIKSGNFIIPIIQ